MDEEREHLGGNSDIAFQALHLPREPVEPPRECVLAPSGDRNEATAASTICICNGTLRPLAAAKPPEANSMPCGGRLINALANRLQIAFTLACRWGESRTFPCSAA
jgi:hypothetical protein